MSKSRGLPITFFAIVLLLAGCSGSAPADVSTANLTPTATETTTAANGTAEVHYINVGQSVNTLVVGPTGETMLIDTGHFRDDGEYVLQYLQRHDIDRIDHLVVSHNDADHIGGTPQSPSTTRLKLMTSVQSTTRESLRVRGHTRALSTLLKSMTSRCMKPGKAIQYSPRGLIHKSLGH